MNAAEDFWAHVDRTAGPESCWPWLLSRDRQGRGWYRYGGKVKFAHHVAEFLTSGNWPRRRQIIPCANDPGCCNPGHFVRHPPDRRRTFKRSVKRSDTEITRMRAFNLLLERAHPDLIWLARLLGDGAGQFISAYEGREITLKMQIPTRAELFDEARGVTSYIEISEAKPEDRENTIERLATRYGCAPVQITHFAKLGSRLLNAANEEVCDEKTR